MVQWRIYYIGRDGVETFDSTMGTPFEAPSYGVGLIVQKHPDSGRQIVMRHDRYYYRTDDNAWWGSDKDDMWDQIYVFLDRISAVKQGRNTSDSKWRELVERAIKDPDFPVLSRKLDHPTVLKQPNSARGQWPGFGDEVTGG